MDRSQSYCAYLQALYSLNSPFGATVTKTIDQTVGSAPTFQLIGRQLFAFAEGSVVASATTGLLMLDTMTYVTRRVVPAQLLDVESLGTKVCLPAPSTRVF